MHAVLDSITSVLRPRVSSARNDDDDDDDNDRDDNENGDSSCDRLPREFRRVRGFRPPNRCQLNAIVFSQETPLFLANKQKPKKYSSILSRRVDSRCAIVFLEFEDRPWVVGAVPACTPVLGSAASLGLKMKEFTERPKESDSTSPRSPSAHI